MFVLSAALFSLYLLVWVGQIFLANLFLVSE